MRKMFYTLENGTVVDTYREAKASGQTFVVDLVEVEEPKHIPNWRKPILKKAGVVK